MATINFTLSPKLDKEAGKKTGKASLSIRFCGGRNLIFRTKSGIFINPERWRNDRVIIPRFDTPERRELMITQKRIDELSNLILSEFAETDRETVNKKWLNLVIDRYRFPSKYGQKSDKNHKAPTVSIFTTFDEFVEKREISVNRKRHYRVLGRMLKRFELYSAISKPDFKMNLETLTSQMLKEFENYLKSEHVLYSKHPEIFEAVPESNIPRQKGQNTIHGIFRKLRCFILWAIAKGLTKNDPFAGFEIRQPLYGTPFYLSIKDRNRIFEKDLSERPHLEAQRDIFIFQCHIGCRVGDLLKLKKSNRINEAVEFIPRKTKLGNPVTVRVPLNKIAKAILSKYADFDSDKLLPFISQVNYNEAIKEFFAIAEVTHMVTVLDSLTREEVQRPINEIASSHLARRTFIANLYRQVRDPDLVSALTGHKEGSKAFVRYRKIDEEIKIDLVKMLE